MRVNSKSKGKRGEYMWRDTLRGAGYVDAVRDAQQGAGGCAEHPDVACQSLSGYHFEVKNTERLNVWSAMAQAVSDCSGSGKMPVVATKRNRSGWLVVMRAEDWLASVASGSAGQ